MYFRLTNNYVFVLMSLQNIRYTCIVKPVLCGHSKRRHKIGFQYWISLNAWQKYCRMLQESILQYFWPSLSYHLPLSPLFCPFLNDHLRQVYCTLISKDSKLIAMSSMTESTCQSPAHIRLCEQPVSLLHHPSSHTSQGDLLCLNHRPSCRGTSKRYTVLVPFEKWYQLRRTVYLWHLSGDSPSQLKLPTGKP